MFAVRAQRKSTGDAARRGQKQPPTRSEVRPETKPETKCLCDVPQRPGRRRTLSFPAPLIVHDTDEGGCRTQRRFSDTRSSDTRSPEVGLEWASRAPASCRLVSNNSPVRVDDQLEDLVTIAEALDDQLGDAQVTVQAIASDLEVDPAEDGAAEQVELSHRRLLAVVERLEDLAGAVQERLRDE